MTNGAHTQARLLATLDEQVRSPKIASPECVSRALDMGVFPDQDQLLIPRVRGC